METQMSQSDYRQMLGQQPRKYACTVVSLLPIELHEDKPFMLPGTFIVPAAKYGDIAFLHVEEGIHYIPNPLVDEGKPGSSFKTVTPPSEMARSIVEDYVSANIATGEDAQPGLFWVEGRLVREEILRFYFNQVAEAKRKQDNWFKNLIAMADADFTKNKNKMSVSDLQRMAARCIGYRAEWVDFAGESVKQCPFCTISIPIDAVKCPNCREIVDRDRYKQLTEGV